MTSPGRQLAPERRIPFRQDAYAAGVDVDTVGFAAFNNLCIAGNDFDAGLFGGSRHAFHNAF